MEMPFICLYKDYLTTLAPFTDSQVGRLVRAMLTYAVTGDVPELRGGERLIWPMLQNRLDRDAENYRKRCAKNRANGAKGGRPKKTVENPETDGISENPKKPKENKNKNENKNENENENKNENEMKNTNGEKNENAGGLADKPPARVFSPPTRQELQDYCAREGFTLEADQFLDYYESNGWMVGRNRMRSWQAAVRNWVRKEKASAGKAEPGQPWGTIGTVL